MRWVTGGTVMAALLLGLTGCGSPTGQVAGKVTQGTQPIAGAELLFQAQQNAEESYRGVSGGDGGYRLDYRANKGATPGAYRVTISLYTLSDGKPLPSGEQGNILKNSGQAVKKAYHFEKEIAAGSNAIDLDLNQGKLIK